MIECVRYTQINKSTCMGMATIFVPDWGIELTGISLHNKSSKRWVNLPARLSIEGDERKYYPYIVFRDKDLKEKFCEQVKKAIDDYLEKSGNDYSPEEAKSPWAAPRDDQDKRRKWNTN